MLMKCQMDFNFNLTPANNESVVFVDWTISFQEVGLQIDVENIPAIAKLGNESSEMRGMMTNLPGESLNGVIDGQDMNAFAVLHIRARLNGHNVSQTDTQVISDDAIHTDLSIGTVLVGKDDADSLLTSFALQEHCITTE
jgi:type V secretory pathway adhesin AidA